MINYVKIFVRKTIRAEKSILVKCLINISLTLAKHSFNLTYASKYLYLARIIGKTQKKIKKTKKN